MKNITTSLVGVNEVQVCLNLADSEKFYDYSMVEITTENGTKTINEINKTIHATIKKLKTNNYSLQLETFDFELKNRNLSIAEKNFVTRISEISDLVLLEISENLEVKTLLNLHELNIRLKQKIKKLATKYIGEKVNNTFQYLKDFYKNDGKILLDTKNYKQHGLLLNPFYGIYTPISSKKNQRRFLNFIENTVVNIEEQAKVKSIKIEKRELEIEVSGKFERSFFIKKIRI